MRKEKEKKKHSPPLHELPPAFKKKRKRKVIGNRAYHEFLKNLLKPLQNSGNKREKKPLTRFSKRVSTITNLLSLGDILTPPSISIREAFSFFFDLSSV